MDEVKERDEFSKDILLHDHLPTNALFDGDAAAKPVKHKFVQDSEKKFTCRISILKGVLIEKCCCGLYVTIANG